jgi:hypothetical protein
MLSYELNQHIDTFLEILESQKYLRDSLNSLILLFDQVSDVIGDYISTNGSSEASRTNQEDIKNSTLQIIVEAMREIKSRQVFKEIGFI